MYELRIEEITFKRFRKIKIEKNQDPFFFLSDLFSLIENRPPKGLLVHYYRVALQNHSIAKFYLFDHETTLNTLYIPQLELSRKYAESALVFIENFLLSQFGSKKKLIFGLNFSIYYSSGLLASKIPSHLFQGCDTRPLKKYIFLKETHQADFDRFDFFIKKRRINIVTLKKLDLEIIDKISNFSKNKRENFFKPLDLLYLRSLKRIIKGKILYENGKAQGLLLYFHSNKKLPELHLSNHRIGSLHTKEYTYILRFLVNPVSAYHYLLADILFNNLLSSCQTKYLVTPSVPDGDLFYSNFFQNYSHNNFPASSSQTILYHIHSKILSSPEK